MFFSSLRPQSRDRTRWEGHSVTFQAPTVLVSVTILSFSFASGHCPLLSNNCHIGFLQHLQLSPEARHPQDVISIPTLQCSERGSSQHFLPAKCFLVCHCVLPDIASLCWQVLLPGSVLSLVTEQGAAWMQPPPSRCYFLSKLT